MLFLIALVTLFTMTAYAKNDKVTLVIIGNITGSIRECLCPHGSAGGMPRLTNAIADVHKNNPDAIIVHVGRLTDDYRIVEETKLLAEIYSTFNCDVSNLYLNDFQHLMNAGVGFENAFFNDIPKHYTTFQKVADGHFRRKNKQFRIVRNGNKVNFTTITANNQIEQNNTKFVTMLKRFDGYNVIDRSHSTEQIPLVSKGINVLLYNIVEKRGDDSFGKTVPEDVRNTSGYDVVILGGGGFFEPEVLELENKNNGSEKRIAIFPGVYGEYIVQLDLWFNNKGNIEKFEWELHYTGTVMPDETVKQRIEEVIGR